MEEEGEGGVAGGMRRGKGRLQEGGRGVQEEDRQVAAPPALTTPTSLTLTM